MESTVRILENILREYSKERLRKELKIYSDTIESIGTSLICKDKRLKWEIENV